ncbi:AF4/FMR2 family member 4-like isoform X2 [Quercus lobata]|uniref:AF4/FMR2 family member 4-like isoform X2 n=1 Tax=Quercus lobata TaxID=97700 RepID=UPI0012452501|nr:AF4/FMR2 family member 4-like isoform X2 [Quercus lobata]
MTEKTKKQKKSFISEDDISSLLQRYSATTVLALLQEVTHSAEVNMDWNALVKNTSTGISDAREYQMLWRHLAYHHTLLHKFDHGAQPLDDDSDLESEVEAFPPVSCESSTEAAACVKVLIASGLPSDTSIPTSSIVEAPLTVNIPSGSSSRASPSENSEATCSMQGMNITVPVSVQKQPLPSAAAPHELLDANGSANGSMPLRRKRKPWSEDEDLELIAAVQKCGEGNWANILRGDFKGDRTATQLSQRWAIIRKRRGNLNMGTNPSGSQLSEERRAAHHAITLALMPVKSLTAARPAAEAVKIGSSSLQAKGQSQQGPVPKKTSPVGSLGSTEKSRVAAKKPLTKPGICSDSALRETAVAAGARIASPSDVASFIKATQAKNAVHIKPTGVSSTKLPMPRGVSTQIETQTNVRYVGTGLEAASSSSHPAVTVIPTASHSGSVKAVSPTIQHSPSTFATLLKTSSEHTNIVSSTLPSEVLPKQEVKTAEEIKASASGNAPKEQVQEDKALSSDTETVSKIQMTDVKNPNSSLNKKTDDSAEGTVVDDQAETRQNANENEMMSSPVRGDNQSAPEVNSENQSANEKRANLPSMIEDECGEKQEVLIKIEAGNEIEGEKVK